MTGRRAAETTRRSVGFGIIRESPRESRHLLNHLVCESAITEAGRAAENLLRTEGGD
jgi:hypothetical protein